MAGKIEPMGNFLERLLFGHRQEKVPNHCTLEEESNLRPSSSLRTNSNHSASVLSVIFCVANLIYFVLRRRSGAVTARAVTAPDTRPLFYYNWL